MAGRIKVKDDDRKWRRILKALREPGRDAHVSIGLHSDAAPYEHGQEEPATVAQVASFHEFGTSKMPARPFLGPTADVQRDAWGELLDRSFALVLKEKLTMRQAFSLVGERAAADVKQAITDVDSPPLAESTILAKYRKASYLGEDVAADYAAGGANPLIDTGHMRASVTYKVALGGEVAGSKPDGE